MFRTSDVVLIVMMVSAAAFTYKEKRGAEDQLKTVRALQSQIRFEQDTISILKADWSLLTQPARLQRLAEIYQTDLKLAPVEAVQFGRIDEITERPLDVRQIIDGADDLVAGQSLDRMTTATVRGR